MALNANTKLLQSTNPGLGDSGWAKLRFLGTGTVNVVKDAANSDIAHATNAAANVTSADVSGVWWSLAAGKVTIARGANTVLVVSGNGQLNKDAGFISLKEDNVADLTVTFDVNAAANGTVFVELTKHHGA